MASRLQFIQSAKSRFSLLELNLSEPEYSRTEIAIGEPHFDEEATVLSARPVVPLEEVAAKSQWRRNVFFAIAVVSALIIGAVGGTFVYRQRNQTEAMATEGVASSSSSEQTNLDSASGGTTEAIANPPQSESSEEPEQELAADQKPKSTPLKKVTEPRTVTASQPSDESVESRQAQRREARRLRRQAKREQRPDGVFRIRDIFEGAPRP